MGQKFRMDVSGMGCETFYVVLVPRKHGKRFSKAGIAPMALQQYFENVFGGNIVINKDGNLLMEFRRGKQGPIGRGTAIPEFYATRNPFTNSFRYSFEDAGIRQAGKMEPVFIDYNSSEGFRLPDNLSFIF